MSFGRTARHARRFRAAGALALALGAATCRDGDPVGPGLPGTASLSIAPQFERAATSGGPTFTSIAKARGILTPVDGGASYATVADFIGDSATLSFNVTFAGARQRYTLDISAIDTAGDTLFRSLGEVTAEPGFNTPIAAALQYVAPDTAVRYIFLSLSDTVLLGGDSIGVTAVGYGAREQRVSPLRLGWTSRDSVSARVSARSASTASLLGGNVEGNVWIVARAFNGTVDSILVPVHLKVASVQITADTLRLALGDASVLAASVFAPGGALLDNRAVIWTSLDSTVALVQPISIVPATTVQPSAALAANRANVIAVGIGTARVVASSGGRSDTTVVVVTPAPVASVTIVPDTIALLAGGRARLSAQLRDVRGNLLTDRAIVWSSVDPLIARVDTDGTVTALAPGLVAIRAVSEGVVGTASVRVDNVPANIVRTVVSPALVTLHSLGAVAQLAARSFQSDSTLVAGTYTWRVSSASIGLLAVDSLGRLTGLAVGTGYVIATEAGGTSDSAQVVILQVPLGVVMNSPPTFDALGMTATIHATAVDSLGAVIPGTVFSWKLDTPAVASVVVLGGDSVVVRGDANGTTSITASTPAVSGTTRLAVAQAPANIVVGPTSLRLGIDGRAQASALTYDRNGWLMTPKLGDLKWAIEGSGGVLEVDQSGEVHARSTGSAGVFAAINGLRSKSMSVDISDQNPLALMFSADTVTFADSVRVGVFLSAARTVPIAVTLSDTTRSVRFSADTLVIQPGLARQDVTLYASVPARTTITATDVGKLFAPAALGVTVGKAVAPPLATRARNRLAVNVR